jgi:hypothetical protein
MVLRRPDESTALNVARPFGSRPNATFYALEGAPRHPDLPVNALLTFADPAVNAGGGVP